MPAGPDSVASACTLPCCGLVVTCSIQWPQGATAVIRTRKIWVLPTKTSRTAPERTSVYYGSAPRKSRSHIGQAEVAPDIAASISVAADELNDLRFQGPTSEVHNDTNLRGLP